MNRSKKKSFDWYGARQRFSIRKYHIGAASVLLGTTLVLGAGTIVGAETGVNGGGTSDGTTSTTQQQSDNQGNNSSGVQTGNTTNSTANVQPAGDTGSASSQPVGTSRSANTGTQGDGTTNPTVDEPIIKFPTSESDPVPNGYVLVSFQKPEYGSYVFNNLPGEFPNATKQSINSRPIQLEVRFWVKEGTTWGQLIEDPNWRWPTMKPNDGDVFIDWNIGYGYSNRFDFNKKKDQPVTTTYFFPVVGYEVEEVEPLNANVNAFLAWYSPEGKSKWLIVTFDAGKGSMTYKNKQYTSRSVAAYFQGIGYDNRQFTSKVVSPTLANHTFVRWQTRDGVVLPKSGTITTETTYEALYLAHPQNQVAVFDSTKLTDSEKEQVKQKIYDANPDLSTGVPQVIKAIEISDTGEATVTFNDDTAVKVPSATLTNEDKATAKSNAKAEIEKDAMEKSAAINASTLTNEEKAAKLADVQDAKDRADIAIDKATTTEDLTKAISDGTAAIEAVSTTSTIKTKAKEALEEAYNTEKAEIENSVLTADEKAIKQADLSKAKENAIKAVDDATTDSAVEGALNNGKATIESTYTAIIKIPSSASEPAPQGYVTVTFAGHKYTRGFTLGTQTGSSVKVFVKNGVTWGTLLDDPAWQWPTVKTDEGDTVVGWSVNDYNYKPGNAFARDNYKDTDVANITLYPNVVFEVEDVNGDGTKKGYLTQYGPDEQNKWIFITFDAGKGQLSGSKQSKMVAVSNNLYPIDFSNKKFKEKVESPTLQGHTFVRWQTEDGVVLPESGKITTDTTYKALYLAHPTDKTVVFDANKLTETEKDSLKQAIYDANPDSANLIQSITVSDTGEAKVTYNDGTVVTVPASDLINEDKEPARNLAKEEIDKASKEKVAEINASALTDEEKAAKLTEVQEAKDQANNAIDNATTTEDLTKALEDGKSEINAINTTTSPKKAVAKQDLETAYNAKKDAITNSGLTAEEKDAKQAELDKAKEEADKAIDTATDNAGVDAALEAGKTAIAGIDTSTSPKKAAAKEELKAAAEDAKNAIDANDNLTDAEKQAAKDAVDAEVAKAEKAIDAATKADEVDAATLAGTKAIAADVLDAAKLDAKNKIAKDLATVEAAIDANSNLSDGEKEVAKLAAQAKAAEAVANIEKATTPEAVQTLEDAAVKDLANIEIKAAYDDAVKAIEAADNLSTAAKTQALEDLKKARQAAEEAIKTASTADEVVKGALDGLKSIAKVEAKAAADDAKAAIAQNSNLTDAEKKVYTDAIDKALKDTETKIDAATDADTVDAETVLAQKDIAKQEVAAATADAVKGIEANTNLTDAEKDEYKATVTKAAETAEKAITDATTAADIQSKTFDATQDVAKEEVKADAADAIAGIKANDNLSDTAKKEAIAAIEEARNTTLENIENAKTAKEVDTATLDAEKANAKAEIKAAADDAKKAIDENANLPASDKNALKLAIDAEVAATNLEIDNAKTAEEIDAATLATEKSIAKAEVKAAAEDALQAIDENANLTDDEKAKAKADVYVELSKAEKAIDKATTADAIDNATLVGEKAFATAELEAAADDAKKAIDANTHLTDDQKQAAKDAVDAELAKAKEAVVAAKTADEVDAATLVGEKAIAKEEIKAAADDAKKAIDANSNLTDDEKATAKAAVDDEVAKANEAIDKAATADAVDTATLVGEKAVAKEELKAAADDAKKAIDENANLTPEEKAAAKKAVDDEVAKAEKAIDAATKAEEVDAATLVGEKAVAKEELKAAADDAKKAIDENANLPESEKTALKLAIDAEVIATNLEIDNAKTAEEIDAATLVGEKAVAKEEVKAAAEDAKKAIDANDNLTPEEKAAAKAAVDAEVAKANDAIDAATKADEVETATLAGEKAVAKEELKAAAEDAKKAIDANDNLTDAEKQAAKDAVDAEVAKANDAIDAATKADEVDAATLAGEKAVAKEELKAAAEDAKAAIDANDNLTDAEKAAAKDAVDAEVAKANEAIDAATKADEVDAATLAGEKAVAKEELKAAADDAKKAIDANDNLTDAEKQAAKDAVDAEVAKANEAIDAATKADEVDAATLAGEKAAAKDAVDAEVAKANEAIDAATKADEVDAATLAGEKAVAKEELKAAADDAKKAIDANDSLTDAEKQAAKDAVDAEVAKAEEAIDAATSAEEVETATLAGEKAVAKEELKAAVEDAKKAIDANPNLSDAEKQAAKDAVDASAAAANKAIDGSTSSVEVQAAKDKGNAAIAENVLDAAKQGAKNKLMEEADKAKAAIDANPNLTPEEKAAAKAEIDKAVEEAIISINGAGTHHALGEIKLPLSALIKPVVTVTPVLDPNNLTEEEIARIKALLEENNTFPEGTEIIVSKDASVSIKYPDGSIDLILPAEIVKQADTTAPAITDDAKGNIVVAPTKEAVEFVVTYVDNNGKAQLVVVTKGADGKWTTTAKAVIVDPVTGQVIIPGSAIKPGTVVTAYSKDMAGNVSDLNSAEVEAVDANNPAAGVKVKSVTSTSNANKSTKKAKQLPNTGEKATSATSLGLAVLGMGLALFAAKRKKDEEEA
ncbi:TPA: DUF1542 domain-containing protein [Streptococcus suis]|nr:DUF1542 domain-containing protein [Streptococcus suis]